jgi:hypothetical protein
LRFGRAVVPLSIVEGRMSQMKLSVVKKKEGGQLGAGGSISDEYISWKRETG